MIAAQEKAQGRIVLELAPEDYSYELLKQSLATESQGSWAKQGAYAAAWKYLIYVLTMKHVTGPKMGRGVKRGAAGRIYSYLRDNHGSFEKNPIATLISYLKRLEGVKIGKFEVGTKTRELQSLYRLEELGTLLDDLNETCGRKPVTVLVDELDKGWDASEDAIAFVSGLFQAAISINKRTPNIRVLISLRKELYDNIPALYEDAQKVRDVIEEIQWDERELFEMITLRIRHALKEAIDIDRQDLWNRVFVERLDYRKNFSFHYMIDRTLYRPREIIELCSQVINFAAECGEKPPLNYQVVSVAENRYSEARVKDIAAEYRFQYPGLLSVFETFRGRVYNISREAIELHCLRISVGDIQVAAAAKLWSEDMEPERMVDMLWRVGFLRARAVGGLKARRRRGSEYLGSHQISHLNLFSIQNFHIHPMYRAYLGLKEK
jgi:hypothetical protein